MKIDKVEKSKYEGYLWYSDSTEPKVYNHEDLELELDNKHNPFIVEGQLFDSKRNISISIKFVDGEYIINQYTVSENDYNKCNVTIKEYCAYRMKDVKKLRFLQYWKEIPNVLCEKMSVLQPVELVFVGFIKE